MFGSSRCIAIVECALSHYFIMQVALYRLYEKQRHSVSNSYAVVSTFTARRQKSFCKNNKERLR
jgi:hypothetical protein